RAPGLAPERRPAPQGAIEDVANDVVNIEGAVGVQRSQAKAVEVEGGTSVAWQCRPVAIDLGKKNLRRFRTVLWLQQERQGTREVRILNSDARDIPAMQVFNSVDCSRIDPPSAGGRNDHQHGSLEGPYPF